MIRQAPVFSGPSRPLYLSAIGRKKGVFVRVVSTNRVLGAGIEVQHHGDFDDAELGVCRRLTERVCTPWRTYSRDYDDAVSLVPVHQQLTTQQAADILNVSRPYLIKLLEQGVMNHHKVGRHRRVRARDVFAYKETMSEERAEALSELARTDSDFI